MLGELKGISHQVNENLPQPGEVNQYSRIKAFIEIDFQADPLSGALLVKHVGDIVNQFPQIAWMWIHQDVVALNTCNVEDVLDQLAEVTRPPFDNTDPFPLFC